MAPCQGLKGSWLCGSVQRRSLINRSIQGKDKNDLELTAVIYTLKKN